MKAVFINIAIGAALLIYGIVHSNAVLSAFAGGNIASALWLYATINKRPAVTNRMTRDASTLRAIALQVFPAGTDIDSLTPEQITKQIAALKRDKSQ